LVVVMVVVLVIAMRLEACGGVFSFSLIFAFAP